MSIATIQSVTHKSRMFDKLDVRDVIAMSKLATQYGLVDSH
jgi:hypothetical protein